MRAGAGIVISRERMNIVVYIYLYIYIHIYIYISMVLNDPPMSTVTGWGAVGKPEFIRLDRKFPNFVRHTLLRVPMQYFRVYIGVYLFLESTTCANLAGFSGSIL